MKRALFVAALLVGAGAQAAPLGLRTAMWGVAGARQRLLLPALGEGASEEQIATVLTGFADGAALCDSITNAAQYAVYRDWAQTVRATDGRGLAGVQTVRDSHAAWRSFALCADRLLPEKLESEDIEVGALTPSGDADGGFTLEVGIRDVAVGEAAESARLVKVFGLEGAATLDPKQFASENVTLEAGEPVDGKVRLTAKPKPEARGAGDAFFLKVRVN